MKILKLSSKNSKEIIRITTELIKKGKVIVCPTDTVYGLISDATNEKTVKKIFRIKKRPKGKPISIFVEDIKMAKEFSKIDKNQERFLRKVWPGALTAVLNPKKNLPKNISQGKNTIGVRIPKYKLVINLIKQFKFPLAETSANISGQPATTRIKEVLKHFTIRRGSGQEKYQPDLIIDAGNLPKIKPSRVLDLTKSPPKILRE